MAETFGDKSNYPLQTLGQWRLLGQAEFTIGASGAVSSTIGDSGFTLAKSDTGVYALVYPACPKVRLFFSLYSPLLTVTECTRTAESATAGTATITTSKGGTAAEPASGDKVTVYALALSRG